MSFRKSLLRTATAAAAVVATAGVAAPSYASDNVDSVEANGVVYSTSPGWEITSITVSPTGITSATTCSSTMCLYVNGVGLHVNYATVTNKSGVTQRPFISSTYDGVTHIGPTRTNNASWRYDYNVTMNNGNKVCGSMEGLGVGCLNITP